MVEPNLTILQGLEEKNHDQSGFMMHNTENTLYSLFFPKKQYEMKTNAKGNLELLLSREATQQGCY